MKPNPYRILVLDDEKTILDLFRRVLCPAQGNDASASRPSFDLTLTERSQEAVEAVRASVEERRPFAMAFLDIRLPRSPDGIWVAEQIRELDSDTVIAMMTGYPEIDITELQFRIRPLDRLIYLEKPLSPREIWQFAAAFCTKWGVEKGLGTVGVQTEAGVREQASSLAELTRQLEREVQGRLSAEESSKESEERFRKVIHTSPDGIIVIDTEGKIRLVNPAAESIFGKKADTLIGESFGYPVIHGETTEIEVLRGKKGPSVVEMRVASTEWEKRPAHLASFRDITDHVQAKEELRANLEVLQKTMKGTIQAIALTVEKRDLYTAGHQERVAELSSAIAKQMGLLPEQVEGIYLAGMVHDIGKIGTPVEILTNPGKLSDIEIKLIEPHPQMAYDILKNIDFPWPIPEMALQHHERMDGSGYPQGLSGEEIVMEARILAVADVIEAMASHRPYRPGLGIEAAIKEISTHRGVLYDAAVVDACLRLFTEKGFEFS